MVNYLKEADTRLLERKINEVADDMVEARFSIINKK